MWVDANVASFQRLMRPLFEKLGPKTSSGALAPVTRRVSGAELGLMLGWMSTRVLGQYDLLVIEDERPEDQDIVYREMAQTGETPPAAPAARTDEQFSRRITPDPVLLFRYSALTFNGHRIHYDRPYAMGEEAYPGLVVHGPLIATLLIDQLRRAHPAVHVRAFEFKAVSPLFDTAPFEVCGRLDGDVASLWARGPQGQLAMQASAPRPRAFMTPGRKFSIRMSLWSARASAWFRPSSVLRSRVSVRARSRSR